MLERNSRSQESAKEDHKDIPYIIWKFARSDLRIFTVNYNILAIDLCWYINTWPLVVIMILWPKKQHILRVLC